MLKRGGYAKDFSFRLGLVPKLKIKPPKTKRVWLQAVSVGELLAIKPIIDEIAEQNYIELIISTTTSTGYKLALERYKKFSKFITIFPIDFWLCSRMAWKRINPDLVILMESELWPEHMHQAKKRNVPILLINARLSDRSFKRYLKLPTVSRWMVSFPNKILTSSKQDSDRFAEIGADLSKVTKVGNLKNDVEISPILNADEIDKFKNELGFINDGNSNTSLIILGSSTWPGEENILINLQKNLFDQNINCRLLLVPRHAERKKEIEQILLNQSLSYHFRSSPNKVSDENYIYVADTTGELQKLTQLADIVFIGKSIPPNSGGQTPIEAAALGKPIIFGPNMTNFSDIVKTLKSNSAAIEVSNENELKEIIKNLLVDKNKRIQLSKAASNWHIEHQGAIKETLSQIESCLGK